VFYSICVLDLKIVKWESAAASDSSDASAAGPTGGDGVVPAPETA
jgi:hypothetical protein